ncbi:MAG: SDR family oxidoreductase [Nitrosopumilaceae archaeon]|nr:SDR family oxidoreductase [Nitrososphaeria archaeon]NDB52051.1 SDR family oxidoreductase [Nitrosopumilaceae archaeon]NDB63530.1 SDR family oxidoreductase [Nitrosopumilaceae archaeon]NDB92553.1 SDR family oxidoreductase [Nitrososphaeria archaeon]NDF47274.1 SDR family oxidoreductase [Nitrosopumilaceae archaeon]
MKLKNKIAIITGASSDIGADLSRRFAEEGATVVMLGRNLKSLEKARESVKGNAVSMACDIMNNSQVISTIEQVVDKYGKIDILVNNAAKINDAIHFHEMKDSDIADLINTNILGTLNMTKAVISKMLDNKAGSIINIGSISSERAIPRVHLAVYSATKAAISMFTKSIAVEYARKNIRCNCLNLGIINAGMIKPYLDDPQARKVLEERQPLNKIGDPQDVSNAAVFLSSDDAKWITGTILNIDGGKSASEG